MLTAWSITVQRCARTMATRPQAHAYRESKEQAFILLVGIYCCDRNQDASFRPSPAARAWRVPCSRRVPPCPNPTPGTMMKCTAANPDTVPGTITITNLTMSTRMYPAAMATGPHGIFSCSPVSKLCGIRPLLSGGAVVLWGCPPPKFQQAPQDSPQAWMMQERLLTVGFRWHWFVAPPPPQ